MINKVKNKALILTIILFVRPAVTTVSVCGNKLVETGEACDDGNVVNYDGCTPSCQVETGWTCDTSQPSVCQETCGKGYRIKEQCDDGNTASGDGCSSTCHIETGWLCSGGTTTTKDSCSEICGDGYLFNINNDPTMCDDDNRNNYDGCTPSCTIETGWSCENSLGKDQRLTLSDSSYKCTETWGDGLDFYTYPCEIQTDSSKTGYSATALMACKQDAITKVVSITTGWSCTGGTYTNPDTCTEVCGDGYLYFTTHGQTCDDDNKISGDGCSSTCNIETGFTCTRGTTDTTSQIFWTTKSTCVETCDGQDMGHLPCDGDGNTVYGSGFGCINCQVRTGFSCQHPSVHTNPSTCSEICGDGINYLCSGCSNTDTQVTVDTHVCDDGNFVDGDGCSSTCGVETGYDCSNTSPTTPTTCAEICGDGLNMGRYQCDDGNTAGTDLVVANADGCTSTCQIMQGWSCSGGSSTTKDTCQEICGDGRIYDHATDTAGQNTLCDDGNAGSGDGCSSTCTVEAGYQCTGGTPLHPDYCMELCGDSKRLKAYSLGGPACDDGNTLSGDGCSNICGIEQGFQCWDSAGSLLPAASSTDVPTSAADYCWEICGDSLDLNHINADTQCVDTTCQYSSTKTTGCDDGNQISGDGCSSSCLIEQGFKCTDDGNNLTPDQCTEICGDGLNMGYVSCDDGNLINGDGCSDSCKIELGWKCSGGSTTTKDVCGEVCGDGYLYSTNTHYYPGVCDDGNNVAGDGCSDTCHIETGWTCTQPTPTSHDEGQSACDEQCDGIYRGGKNLPCDNAKVTADTHFDGCSDTCAVDPGWACDTSSTGIPTPCHETCGDGWNFDYWSDTLVAGTATHHCDDGNTISGDGCSDSCMVEVGPGGYSSPDWFCSHPTIVWSEHSETNGILPAKNSDTCYERCGDGRFYGGGIACDDGNVKSGDGCSSTCFVERGFECSGGSPTTKDICDEICGDGFNHGYLWETYLNKNWGTSTTGLTFCDDGNFVAGDGCNAHCVVETGYKCSGGSSSSADTCKEICGDGLDFGTYACEYKTGDTASTQGCNTDCSLKTGWTCTGGTPTTSDSCFDVCGDHINEFHTGTNCDVDTGVLGCTATCTIETGYYIYQPTDGSTDSMYAKCGDGYTAVGTEQCDDAGHGDTTSTEDGCQNCKFSMATRWDCDTAAHPTVCTDHCGDGYVMNPHAGYCDDGNTYDYDGCDHNCKVVSSNAWTCTLGSETGPSICQDVCGDGVRFKPNVLTGNDVIDECDIGNTLGSLYCTPDCKWTSDTIKFTCTGGYTTPDVCVDKCGDGYVMYPSATYCDDGNTVSGDGCNQQCQPEPGWDCTLGDSNSPSKCTDICGNGFRFTETSPYNTINQCDDGNTVNGDGCSDSCHWENHQYWNCIGGITKPDICYDICGDGVVMKANSTNYCDDGNTKDWDGCDHNCIMEPNYWDCHKHPGTDTSPTICLDICGDGHRAIVGVNTTATDANFPYINQCDDGNTIDLDGCNHLCQWEDTNAWSCSGGGLTPDHCVDHCGDGFIYLAPGQSLPTGYCDDGNTADWDGCNHKCSVEAPHWTCVAGDRTKPSICTDVCGDGLRGIVPNNRTDTHLNNILDQCDDGNTINNDGCSDSCHWEAPEIAGKWVCTGGVTVPDHCIDNCNDGFNVWKTLDPVKYADYCDQGDTDNLNGCTTSCSIVTGWHCFGGNVDTHDTCLEICGDGLIVGHEQCDDGNTHNLDGCSWGPETQPRCDIETGWACTGQASVCKPICGDGINVGPETWPGNCDDGNTAAGDGCSSTCTEEPGWWCHGGTDTSADACQMTALSTPVMQDCENFAAMFENTCGSTSPVDLPSMKTQSESCDNVGNCPGTLSGTLCTWERKLCVTCRYDKGERYIRVQTNAFPDHCFDAQYYTPVENLLDFEVKFDGSNMVQTIRSLSFNTQNEVDNQLCSYLWSKSSNLPAAYAYTLTSGNDNSVLGVTLNGIPIFTGTSELGFDAYYPKDFRNQRAQAISPDICLGDNDYTNFYHYYSFSPCILNSAVKSLTKAKQCSDDTTCQSQKIQYAASYLTSAQKTLVPVGIAKDGHMIYGPFNNNGKLWQPCDVDICNGRMINNKYAYVSTVFYPYIAGCFGPGNSPLLNPACSTNPRQCTGAAASGSYLNISLLLLAVVSLFYVIIQ